jgi:hypothetical protein
VKKQKALLVEECEHLKKVKQDCEKRLDETLSEKKELEISMHSKLNELQQFKSDSENYKADQLSHAQVILNLQMQRIAFLILIFFYFLQEI